MMALLLAFTVCCYPFVCAKKAEAFAPAVGAIGAAAALAAELGITTEALMTGLAVITAAGTGVYLLESSDYATSSVALNDNQWGKLWGDAGVSDPGYAGNWDEEYQKYKFGNGKSWDELTDEEKANWSNPAEYVQSQWLGYLIGTGLIQETTHGNFEPTPEPNRDDDPNENSTWNKARNVLTILGVGGGAVALNEAVGWFADSFGGSIHDWLFGNSGFGLQYTMIVPMLGEELRFYSAGPWTYNNVNFPASNWSLVSRTNTRPIEDTSYNDNFLYFIKLDGSSISNICNVSYNGSSVNKWSIGLNGRGSRLSVGYTSGKPTGTVDNSSATVYNYKGTQYFGLNMNYTGTYNLPDGSQLSNGAWIVQPDDGMTYDYGSMGGTPSDLKGSVGNNNSWVNYINNVSAPDGNGMVNAVVTPSVLSDGLTYDDIVKPVNQEDVVPVPDDQPVTPPEPEPEPGLSPDAPDGFEDDMTDSVNRIMRNPIDQVFPFCLIADFRDLIFIMLAGDTELGQNTSRLQPNTIQTQSDTPTDELNGVNRLYLDFGDAFEGFEVDIPLEPVHDLLLITRLPVTILFILALVYETFGFFLKRGGE